MGVGGARCSRGLVAAGLLLGAAACLQQTPEGDAGTSPKEPRDAAATPGPPAPFAGTAGIVEREPGATGVVTLTAVRAGRHDGFDRVTFEMAGEELPGYHLEYVDRPVRQCGSGEPVSLAGDGWLEVRMEPARSHDDEGRSTTERALDPRLPVVLEARITCDFEAVVTWVLGVRSPNRYRVLELEDPNRLVVDVGHR